MKKVTNQSGFSYVDVMVAITILLVGVLGLVAAITRGIAMTTVSQEMLGAKQLAAATMESIFTARELDSIDLGWNSIGNVGSSTVPNGIFPVDAQPIYPSAGLDRKITVTDIPDATRPTAPISLRKLEVTINYWTSGRQRAETFTSFIANYRTEVTLDN
jgi:Tfp pilus assembly protein PilV